jgi:hypothetical protein
VPPPADAHWQITQLDLSRCNLGQRGLAALGEALAAFEHGLQLLDLSYCDLPEKPLAAFFEALQRNFAVSLTLEAYSPPPSAPLASLSQYHHVHALVARAHSSLYSAAIERALTHNPQAADRGKPLGTGGLHGAEQLALPRQGPLCLQSHAHTP